MSYLVLARKWRPQVFEDVIGQRPITRTLQNAISQNRVAHAFLFTGARGVGKTSTARILAKALNCEKGPQINPCNECATCHEISLGTSMDVVEIDGASNRGIDEIRELRENVRYTPAKNRYKIYIIDEVHMLTREAFNALLKTLEEPPSHVVFIFATTEPHKIPATILSRCQRYDFRRIPLKEVIDTLKRITDQEGVQISQRGLISIARESEGSMRDAQSLLDQVISYSGKNVPDKDLTEVLGLVDRKILSDTIEALAHRNAGRCIEIVAEIYHYGYDLQHFCRELLQYLRNLILMKVSLHPEGLIELSGEEVEILKRQAEDFQFDQLNHLFTILLKGEEEIAQSAFPRTILEMALIRMATLPSILPLDEILNKLESLEREEDTEEPDERMDIPSIKKTEDKRKEEPEQVLESRFGTTDRDESEKDKPHQEDKVKEESFSEANEEAWKGLVDFARARNPILGSFLILGGLVRLNHEEVEIGFEKDSFHYERITERENRSQLETICNQYFNRKVKVIITPLNQGVQSKGRLAARAEEPSNNEHPLIQEAIRLFNGKIVKQRG